MTKPKEVMPSKEDSKAKKPRLKKSDGSNPAESEKPFIGQEVHGIVDGSFDAGYLLTVKVGDSPLVLRGLVFEPGLSVPLSKVNDIAPKVKATIRDQQVVFPTPMQPNAHILPAAAGSSPASSSATGMPSTHSQDPAATNSRDIDFREGQAPSVAEEGQFLPAGHAATKQEQVTVGKTGLVKMSTGPEQTSVVADPVATKQQQIGTGQPDVMMTATKHGDGDSTSGFAAMLQEQRGTGQVVMTGAKEDGGTICGQTGPVLEAPVARDPEPICVVDRQIRKIP